jgi:hypothetical protein
MNDDHLYRDPHYPGMLSSVIKIRNTGREELVCPDEPQKGLPDLGKSLKAPPLHLYPENSPKPR